MGDDVHVHGDRGPAGWRPEGIEHRPEMATLIVNPNAGRGRVGRDLPSVEAALREQRLPYRVLVSKRPGEATRMAREALDRGERFLVAVEGLAGHAGGLAGPLRDQ